MTVFSRWAEADLASCVNGPAQGRLPLAVTQLLVLNPHWVPFCSPGGIDSVDSSLLHTDIDRMRKHTVIQVLVRGRGGSN